MDAGTVPPVAAAAIRLLMLTGCRKGEVLALRWADVDLDAGGAPPARREVRSARGAAAAAGGAAAGGPAAPGGQPVGVSRQGPGRALQRGRSRPCLARRAGGREAGGRANS